MSPSSRPPEPWDSFFKELDEAVNTTVRLDCIGGFNSARVRKRLFLVVRIRPVFRYA